MLIRELMPSTAGWDVKVIATDISSRALEAAREGRYGARAVQMATPDELSRFFQPVAQGGHEVRPEIRELVEFRHHNLVTEPVPFAPDERVDLILCRNVTIYFGRQTTRALMERLHRCLRDGGYLFLGHSETLWQVSEQFHLVSLGTGDAAAFVYRRQDAKGERRAVLPDRRTADEGPPSPRVERRLAARRTESPKAAAAKPTPKPAPVAPVEPAPADPVRTDAIRATIQEGEYELAVQLAGDLITADPLNPEGFYLRGLALTDLGRDEEALVDLRKAVYLEPSMGFAHFLLAGVLDRLGHPAAAAVEYGATADTLGKYPGDATAHELGGRSVRELVQLCRQLEGIVASRAGVREEVR
jgi:chemotaxis protein methyltransferase CheR